jgi:hypothetical protein
MVRGIAMAWFKQSKRTEIWDEPIEGPMGDIEAAHKIRDICRSAVDSAAKVGGLAGPSDGNDVERYERAAKVAMEIAMKISDGLLRDSSVRQIVDLCMKANNLRTARILFRAIQAVSIREEVVGEHPALRQ